MEGGGVGPQVQAMVASPERPQSSAVFTQVPAPRLLVQNSTMPPLSSVQQTLLPDILGFSPQLVVDDLLDIGYDAIGKATEALEAYLHEHWLPGKSNEEHDQADAGLVAFQTLLQSHLDKAFDAFEMWSLKNVFALPDPTQVPLVLPHQKGLNLAVTEQEENTLNNEIDELRRKIDAVGPPSVIEFLAVH